MNQIKMNEIENLRLEELRRLMEEYKKEKHNINDLGQEEGQCMQTAEDDFSASISLLDDMVGMEHVKELLLRLGRYMRWRKKLEFGGIDTSNYPMPNLTFMFLGEPGTGKTTVANRMGSILYNLGLLENEKVIVFRREDLVGENYGSEEGRTKDALEQTEGGVLFLDEAYQCFKMATDKRDPGYHILETMMQEFGAPGRCIIMAGYKDEMLELTKVNPGFLSRIPRENIIEFKGVTETSMMRIATDAFKRMEFTLTFGAKALLRGYVHEMLQSKDKTFGNARTISHIVESAVIHHANRIMTTTEVDDFRISKADIRQSLVNLPTKKTLTHLRIGFV